MKKIFLAAVAIACVIAGCGKLPEAELWKRVESARANNNADSTIQVCQKIIAEYPQGTTAPAAMYMIGEMYQNGKRDYRAAIGQYRLFIKTYPDLKQTPVALFLIGFLYNNELKMADSAKAADENFIAKYPTHELKSSAEFEISSIGKNPDEIIKDDPPAKKPAARKGSK